MLWQSVGRVGRLLVSYKVLHGLALAHSLMSSIMLLSPFTGSSCCLECSSRFYVAVSSYMKSWLRCYYP